MQPKTLGSNFTTGSKNSIGNTAVQLSSTTVTSNIGITVKASSANGGRIYVGSTSSVTSNTNASTDGFELAAGESILVPVGNVNQIYVIASAPGQKAFWMTA